MNTTICKIKQKNIIFFGYISKRLTAIKDCDIINIIKYL